VALRRQRSIAEREPVSIIERGLEFGNDTDQYSVARFYFQAT
jgi:hypothetical protein